MHGRSGGAKTACLGRTPSVGTRVLSSVSAFGGCSFALRDRATRPETRGTFARTTPPVEAGYKLENIIARNIGTSGASARRERSARSARTWGLL
eukprot:2276899-Prymnesium_polylepis.1